MAYKVIELQNNFLAAKIADYLSKMKKGSLVSAIDLQIKLKHEKVFAKLDEVEAALKKLWQISQLANFSLIKIAETDKGYSYQVGDKMLLMLMASSPQVISLYLKQTE